MAKVFAVDIDKEEDLDKAMEAIKKEVGDNIENIDEMIKNVKEHINQKILHAIADDIKTERESKKEDEKEDALLEKFVISATDDKNGFYVKTDIVGPEGKVFEVLKHTMIGLLSQSSFDFDEALNYCTVLTMEVLKAIVKKDIKKGDK